MSKSPFKLLHRKEVYKNPWIHVMEDKVLRKDGEEGVFGTIKYKKGVSIVALTRQQEIYLVKEYYYAREEFGIQLPSGGIEGEQTPEEAAKNELLEEVGVTAQKWTRLGYVHPLTMILRNTAFLYLAEETNEYKTPEEGIEMIKVPFDKAVQMVMDSEITHAPSCIAILKAKVTLTQRQNESPNSL